MLKMSYRQIKIQAQKAHAIFERNLSLKYKSKRNLDFGAYVLLSVPLATFCLGCWQVKRRTWKLNLIEDVKKQYSAAPIELPDDLEDLSKMEYQRIHIRGTFDHSKEMYIGPRQLMEETTESSGIMSSRSKIGNLVITPFHISNGNVKILVNRGWVSRDKTDPSKRNEGQVTKEIDLIGTVRLLENRPQFSPKSKSDSNFFHYRDVIKMAKLAGTAPIYIDADSNSTIPGGPIGGQTRITFRNEHLSYIITWYSLSAATLYMWYKKYFHSKKF